MSLLAHQARLFGGGGGGGSYDDLMLSLSPFRWWKLEEVSGTTIADSSGNGGHGTSVSTIVSGNVSPVVPAVPGVGQGVSGNMLTLPCPAFMGNASGAWTIVMWLVGASGANNYVLHNSGNRAAFIYNYVAGNIELFRNVGGSGGDPRPNSQIPLSTTDPNPSMIVYRYNNGNWSGFKNGVKVFDVSRSFALADDTGAWTAPDTAGVNPFAGKRYDLAFFNKALSDSQIADLYEAATG